MTLSAVPSPVWRAAFVRPPARLGHAPFTPNGIELQGAAVIFRAAPSKVQNWFRGSTAGWRMPIRWSMSEAVWGEGGSVVWSGGQSLGRTQGTTSAGGASRTIPSVLDSRSAVGSIYRRLADHAQWRTGPLWLCGLVAVLAASLAGDAGGIGRGNHATRPPPAEREYCRAKRGEAGRRGLSIAVR